MGVVVLLGTATLAYEIGGQLVENREWVTRMRSESRFAQIRLMLQNYHDEFDSFPPARYQPKAGGPVHSWRILLLHDTDPELYSKYDFSEKWNSPRNLAIGPSFQSAYFRSDENNKANYLAIADGDEWPSDEPLNAFLVTKGTDRFLVVEYPDSGVHWMEPKF